MGLPLTDRIYDAEGVSMRESRGGRPTSYLGTAVARLLRPDRVEQNLHMVCLYM